MWFAAAKGQLMTKDTPARYEVIISNNDPISKTIRVLESFSETSAGARVRLEIVRRWATSRSFGPDHDFCIGWDHRKLSFVSFFDNATFYYSIAGRIIYPTSVVFGDDYFFLDNLRKMPRPRKVRFLDDQPITACVRTLEKNFEANLVDQIKLETILAWTSEVTTGSTNDFLIAWNHREVLFGSFFNGAIFFYVLRGEIVLPLGVIFDIDNTVVGDQGTPGLTFLFAAGMRSDGE